MHEPQLVFSVVFGALFLSVLVWFFLVLKLFRHLRTQHLAKYQAMGEPSLFMNNSIRTNLALLRFLFKREDKALNDAALSTLTETMRTFLVVYSAAFLAFMVWFLVILARHAP